MALIDHREGYPLSYPLEPDAAEMHRLAAAVVERAIAFVDNLKDHPASLAGMSPGAIQDLQSLLLSPPPEVPEEGLDGLLGRIEKATAAAVETAGPGYLAYIPGGGIFASAVADLYARATNRYVGMAATAPGLAALEWSIVRWLADVVGMPAGGGGILVSGGSIANLAAVVAARERLGEEIADGTLYVTQQAHQSVGKAARLAGLPQRALRVVPCTSDLRMDAGALSELVAQDRRAGLRPFLVVASAGTTNTGVVDPLEEVADVAEAERLWLHVDGAYGGLFRLTDRGRAILSGIERADSVTLDPHKSLFSPYGTGALVVRDLDALRSAHAVSGHYLQDLDAQEIPDPADLGPELTRELRGLRIWLPLHLYGVAAFRQALDEKLDLARHAYRRLAAEPLLDLPWPPTLSIVGLRVRAGDAATADDRSRAVLERVNAGLRVFLSSTVVDGRFTLRLAVLAHRSHRDRVDEAVDAIIAAAREVASD